jgi:hypothetical protein
MRNRRRHKAEGRQRRGHQNRPESVRRTVFEFRSETCSLHLRNNSARWLAASADPSDSLARSEWFPTSHRPPDCPAAAPAARRLAQRRQRANPPARTVNDDAPTRPATQRHLRPESRTKLPSARPRGQRLRQAIDLRRARHPRPVDT